MARNIVGAIVSAGLALAAVAEGRLPSFESPCLQGRGSSINTLAALAGPDWREVAEKNRKPELKYLSKAKIIALMQKYADKELYLIGASLKDLGQKCFAFTKLDAGEIRRIKKTAFGRGENE